MPDWMSSLDFDQGLEMPAGTIPGVQGEDLLGFSGDMTAAAPAEKEEKQARPAAEEATELEASEMPDWLRGVAGLGREEEVAPATDAEGVPVSADLLNQIQDLKFAAITGSKEPRPETEAETVGALKNVSGVIQPELIFDGSTLTASTSTGEMIITADQSQRIDLIRRMVSQEKTSAAEGGRQRVSLPILRWIAAVLLALAVLAPVALGVTLLPPGIAVADQGQLTAAANTISALPEGGTVLVAFEYEPDTAAEMQPLADALLKRLAARESLTVYAISTRPTGPAMAEAAFSRADVQPRLASNGGTWIDLGYVSGRTNGVNSLTVGATAGATSPWATDFRGQPISIRTTRLLDGTVDLIVVVTAQADDLRMWVEQAGQPAGIPILAAVSAGAAPMAQPYRMSGQVPAVLSGVNDAVAFGLSGGDLPDPGLSARWNGQALGGAAVVLLIVLGSLIYGLGSFRDRQEQER